MEERKNKYVYPAIFDYADDGISISFPDLPGCFSCGDNDSDALAMAKEALGLHLWSLEHDGDPIPEPSAAISIKHERAQAVMLIEVWMPPIRERIDNRSVKTTVTLPKWLKDTADEHGVNFSQVLQSAIKEQLGLEKQ